MPFQQGRLAAAADTGTAGIRQRNARALRRFQHGFPGSHWKLAAGHFESDGRHQTHCRGDESGQQCGLDTQESTMSLWKQPTDLARINAWSANTMMQTLDIRISAIGDDWLQGTMPVDHRTHQPYGLLHGGASVVLAETLGSTAAMLTLDPEKELAVGLDINANHVRGVRSGTVTGTARMLHLGRTTQVWEIRIENEEGALVCISRITMAVIPARAAGPR
jgi:1,4-dihydroxy-2-naphthoyl-CoA hydrolase